MWRKKLPKSPTYMGNQIMSQLKNKLKKMVRDHEGSMMIKEMFLGAKQVLNHAVIATKKK